jgi:Glycosyltransferases, probably involved in cell wall biogenesis
MIDRATPVSVSVIVPTLDEAHYIRSCVASALAQEAPVDVVVVDGGSRDGTPDLVKGRATVMLAGRGRAVQLNAGTRRATSDVLLFLHADSTLHPHALAGVRAALSDADIVGGTFTLRFDRRSPLLDFYAWCTRLPLGVFRYGDQGIFVRRRTFEALGGFREWPLMDDVDFLTRMRTAGRTALVPLPVTTSARRFTGHGVVRQQLRNVLLVALYRLGVSPTTLAIWYGVVR